MKSLKPKWKYKINLKLFYNLINDHKWIESFIELRKRIKILIDKILPEDKELEEQLVEWTKDLWVDDKQESNGFVIIKNDDDWEELEYELNNLYDVFDYEKMVWAEW